MFGHLWFSPSSSGSIFLSKKNVRAASKPVGNTRRLRFMSPSKRLATSKQPSLQIIFPASSFPKTGQKFSPPLPARVATAPFEVGDAVALGTVLFAHRYAIHIGNFQRRIAVGYDSAGGNPSFSYRKRNPTKMPIGLPKRKYQECCQCTRKRPSPNSASKRRNRTRECSNNALVRATLSGVISKKCRHPEAPSPPERALHARFRFCAPRYAFISNTIHQDFSRREYTVYSGIIFRGADHLPFGAVADPSTGNFPVEAEACKQQPRAGTVATVSLTSKTRSPKHTHFSSALRHYHRSRRIVLLYSKSGKTKKLNATIHHGLGETGIVSADDFG